MSKNRIIPLSEIGEIITGNTPKTSDTENYESNDIPFLKPSDFSTDNIDLFDTEFYISEKARNKARVLPVGSIVVTCIGIIGKTKITQKECAFNQQINAIIPFNGNNNRYIAYAISFQKELLQTKANAAVVPIINKTEFSKISIPLPPLETQRKIASNLDKVTHTIDLCNAILEKLDLLVKSRFVEMFGTGEHKLHKLKDVCAKITDGEHGTVERFETGRLYLMARNITADNQIDLSEVSYISDEDHNRIYARCNPEYGDLLLVCVGATIGKMALVPQMESFSMARSVALIKPNKTCLNSIFLMASMQSQNVQVQIKNSIHSSAQGGLYTKSIQNLSIPLPPLELQQQFAAFIEQTDKSKSAVKQVLEKAETLKRALMQEYFG